VVDDTPRVLDELVAGLSRDAQVVPCRSGEEAVGQVRAKPGSFEFAVIDQLLGHGIDGIETCQQIADISGDIFILVFTNVPAVDQAELEEHRWRTYAAGAHRYLERASEVADLLSVRQFVDEMEQLAQLRTRISEFYDERRQIPSLLTQLDLGVDIVDRFYKVWFMNDAMRRIIGVSSGPGLPRPRCSAWHKYQLCPCPGCLVAQTLESGRPGDRIFLSPIKERGDGLFYLHVWTQPVKDDRGEIMLASNGKPLAVMETVQDLTNTEQLRAMAFDERLKLVATALHERLRPGYVRQRPFERVTVYAVDPGQSASPNLQLRALAGYADDSAKHLHAPFDRKQVKDYDAVVLNLQKTGWGFHSSDDVWVDPIDGKPLTRCVYWPIFDGGGRLIAFVRAGGASCDAADVALVRAYAQQVAAAIEQCRPPSAELISLNAERHLARIDNKLQTIGSPEAALRYLLMEGCEFTGSHLGHIRFRRDNQAVLSRLSPNPYDAYERVASIRWPLDHLASWSARTILSGIEQYRDDLTSRHEALETERQSLSVAARETLDSARSFCFEPLIFDNRCLGAIGFHSEAPNTYTGDKLLFLRQIARRASLALHDQLAKRAAEEQLESVQASTVELLLHNINTPLGTLRNCVKLMHGVPTRDAAGAADLAAIADAVEKASNRIGRIREDFARLLESYESKPLAINLHELLRKWVIDEVGDSKDVHVCFDLDSRLATLVTDDVAARSCVEVFVRNSLDEFARLPSGHEHTLRIVLRPAERHESERCTSAGPFLAVEVQDNGPGVPEERRDSLFDIIRSTKGGGLGIGLVCCRRMARAADGDAFLKDQVDPGATFVALLPYQNPGSETGESHANPPSG
jgi:signal transduction histidine kinase/PAS domain-containing protein